MKYDSSMTQFKDVIIANLRSMCSSVPELSENFSSEKGSPAPLRDYLKEKCSSLGSIRSDEGINWWGSKSKGVELRLDVPVNDDGDKILLLSWSQVTTFIRNNWDEIFRKSETGEIDEAKPTYKDVLLEHYPNFDVSKFEDFAENFCIDSFFDDGGQFCPYGGEDGYGKCKKHWENRCLFEWHEELDSKEIEEYLVPKADKTPAQEIIPAPAEETPAVFDYSELDSDRAKTIASSFNYALLTAEMGDFLKRKEQQLKNEYMSFTANCGQIFAEAQEKLSREKDGSGLFLKWITYMGFKKSAVYRMIDVYRFSVSQIGKLKPETQEIFEALPKMLRYDISAKSAPPELVEQVMNGDIITHEKYIALKKQLKDAQKQAENAEMQSQTYQQNYLQMSKNFDEACEENTNLDERIKELEKQLKEALDKSDDKKIAELEAQIKELESRPIEVVYEKDETEINRLQEENTQFEKQLREAQDELMFAAPPADDIKIFAVKLTLEEYEALTDIADKYGSAIIGQAVKNAQIIRI